MELYYKNNDVIVSSDFYDSELLVVSFSPLVDEKHIPTKDNGFGRVFFQNRKISCVYIIPIWNHWYQYEYIGDAIDIIRLFARNFKKVVIYGVSMGGYAALKYANYLGSSGVISISPQAVITGTQSEFDKRFSRFWDKIEFKSDSWTSETNHPINTMVLYDKYHVEDNGHAKIISRNIKHAKMVGLPFSGHEVFAVLNEAGILSDFIFALINGKADHFELLRLYRKNRHKSGVAWMYAAQNSFFRGRSNLAGRLYRKAVDVIEWRKSNGLNVDLPKARMTLMAYVVYCFKVGDFEAFLDIYSRFSDNKIIEVDLSIKRLEYYVLRNDKEGFLAALKTYKKEGREIVGAVESITVIAIDKNLVSEADLV
jgi:pimeloyl-ACP methyl ester carboxylesterase